VPTQASPNPSDSVDPSANSANSRNSADRRSTKRTELELARKLLATGRTIGFGADSRAWPGRECHGVRWNGWRGGFDSARRVGVFVLAFMAVAAGVSPAASRTSPAAVIAHQGAPSWHVVDLGTLGGRNSYAYAIDQRGQVVGASETAAGAVHAFFWSGGRMTDLGTLPGRRSSSAVAVNDSGEVAGVSFDGSLSRPERARAFLWRGRRMIDLGTLGGASSWVTGLNARGQVVGWATTRSGFRHAFVWAGGRITDLGTLARGATTHDASSWAVAINDHGEVVGTTDAGPSSDIRTTAFLWRGRKLVEACGAPRNRRDSFYGIALNERGWVVANGEGVSPLLCFGGRRTSLGTPLGGYPEAAALNDRGQIVGESLTSARLIRAFLWEQGKMLELPTPPGMQSQAVAINERGQVVGWAGNSSLRSRATTMRAFVWQRTQSVELPALPGGNKTTVAGGRYAEPPGAQVLDERGRIAGWSTTRSGARHAVLWLPRNSADR